MPTWRLQTYIHLHRGQQHKEQIQHTWNLKCEKRAHIERVRCPAILKFVFYLQKMGSAVSSTRRALRNWNATNRAIRQLDKTANRRQSPKPFQMNASAKELEKELLQRNPELEKKVLSFNITSQGVKKSILPEGFDYVPKSKRKLPQVFIYC